MGAALANGCAGCSLIGPPKEDLEFRRCWNAPCPYQHAGRPVGSDVTDMADMTDLGEDPKGYPYHDEDSEALGACPDSQVYPDASLEPSLRRKKQMRFTYDKKKDVEILDLLQGFWRDVQNGNDVGQLVDDTFHWCAKPPVQPSEIVVDGDGISLFEGDKEVQASIQKGSPVRLLWRDGREWVRISDGVSMDGLWKTDDGAPIGTIRAYHLYWDECFSCAPTKLWLTPGFGLQSSSVLMHLDGSDSEGTLLLGPPARIKWADGDAWVRER
mmetsp:Transcript_53772/g.116210  ORF Transcript_53772/g.116210 Transcript_53772/m.116210 type:complete len:270 (-) Transcript_53772:164-973(-)